MTTDPAISAVAALDDVLRQGMYAHIRRARRPVTRDEAAASVGISRKLAAFHLDKLVDAGLLRARYEPVGGIRKVGRTPKVYEPAETDIRVTIPERRHEVLADILMDAVLAEGEDGSARQAAVRVAGRRGEEIGASERARAKPGRLGAERALTLIEGLLSRHGFEPGRESPTCVRLRNCPFHPLAARAPELVCGINHAFLDGMLTGLEATRVRAVLAPRQGECCVELRSSPQGDKP
uniref:helix-turn-helix transcriptional regulator n=1 Tax=Microbispora cellulosiformans TaxID=2614688 RepID=UPI001CD9C81F|nr:transcriptional regulator [Microbispora cellulosiformans]